MSNDLPRSLRNNNSGSKQWFNLSWINSITNRIRSALNDRTEEEIQQIEQQSEISFREGIHDIATHEPSDIGGNREYSSMVSQADDTIREQPSFQEPEPFDEYEGPNQPAENEDGNGNMNEDVNESENESENEIKDEIEVENENEDEDENENENENEPERDYDPERSDFSLWSESGFDGYEKDVDNYNSDIEIMDDYVEEGPDGQQSELDLRSDASESDVQVIDSEPLPVHETVNEPVNESVSEPTPNPTTESVSESVSESAPEPVESVVSDVVAHEPAVSKSIPKSDVSEPVMSEPVSTSGNANSVVDPVHIDPTPEVAEQETSDRVQQEPGSHTEERLASPIRNDSGQQAVEEPPVTSDSSHNDGSHRAIEDSSTVDHKTVEEPAELEHIAIQPVEHKVAEQAADVNPSDSASSHVKNLDSPTTHDVEGINTGETRQETTDSNASSEWSRLLMFNHGNVGFEFGPKELTDSEPERAEEDSSAPENAMKIERDADHSADHMSVEEQERTVPEKTEPVESENVQAELPKPAGPSSDSVPTEWNLFNVGFTVAPEPDSTIHDYTLDDYSIDYSIDDIPKEDPLEEEFGILSRSAHRLLSNSSLFGGTAIKRMAPEQENETPKEYDIESETQRVARAAHGLFSESSLFGGHAKRQKSAPGPKREARLKREVKPEPKPEPKPRRRRARRSFQ